MRGLESQPAYNTLPIPFPLPAPATQLSAHALKTLAALCLWRTGPVADNPRKLLAATCTGCRFDDRSWRRATASLEGAGLVQRQGQSYRVLVPCPNTNFVRLPLAYFHLTPATFRVAVAMATYANHTTGEAWATMQTVARRAGVTRQALNNALAHIKDGHVVYQRAGKRWYINTRWKVCPITGTDGEALIPFTTLAAFGFNFTPKPTGVHHARRTETLQGGGQKLYTEQ